MMAFWYLVLAVFLAVTLNLGNRFVRAFGTTVACLSLVMMVSSIILADFDGTFVHMPAQPDLLGRSKPLILNIQAAVGTAGILFLLWAAWRQGFRCAVLPLPVFNSAAAFGLVSRYAHWIIAVLILALIPMGMFMSILPANSPDRGSFVAAHQTMGLLVLIFVVLRMAWLLRSPPAAFSSDLKLWERRLGHAVHVTLYGLILAFPLTGLFEMMCRGETVQFFGQAIPAFCTPNLEWSSVLAILHDRILPLIFYGTIFAHLGAVLKHHFVDKRVGDVRRMLR
jgi:cytochrome b561